MSRLHKSLTIGLSVLALTVAANAGAATLKASYFFDNTLASSTAGAPDLVAIDPSGTSGFVTDTVYGNSRQVFHVGGTNANANQGGLAFNSTGLLTSDSYSVALTFEFFDRANAWRRILDVTNRTSDAGFYVDPGNQLDVYPISGSSVAFTNDVYRNVALTVGPAGPNNVTGYIDGIGSFTTTTNTLDLLPGGLINLFIDNNMGGGQGEWSTANIASARFYDGVLTAAEVGAINHDPVTPPPVGGVPEPASWAMMLVGFGSIGTVLRRRTMTGPAITA
ncbi:PEPxxWA-CTERM sorting domain-containing protein [Polymorphobacter sp. PAMC 29334]|uniref:PEPxxWA-CTERM sorting domain-containing protein n=1 Tax=Polymorphobacter sp. PAMC 29334 TaxID=2862331 RepID=UPI001D008DCF|nr:PEPxxWA-CTERM sorting domain-containing protein [Polymorphobacter sp. PAMC 29334]